MNPDQGTCEPGPLDVVTVGHALVDVLGEASDDFLSDEGLAKGSMELIDDRRAGLLYGQMGVRTETSGGSAANTAAGVVACGGSAAFIGTVAGDPIGETFAADLRAAGVEYATAPLPVGPPTGQSFIFVTPDGERTMNTNVGAGALVSMGHLDPALLGRARITYVEGFLFDDNHPLDGWSQAVEVIHSAGKRFSVSLSDSFCVERHRSLFLALLDGAIDICFGNAEEVCALFEIDDLDRAIDELSGRCEMAAVTRGAKGSVLATRDSRVEIPARQTKVVDTTGAGDLYAAGVLYGLSKGWALERCGAMGATAASAIIGQMGARLARPLHQVAESG